MSEEKKQERNIVAEVFDGLPMDELVGDRIAEIAESLSIPEPSTQGFVVNVGLEEKDDVWCLRRTDMMKLVG